ncbi:G/T mismatches repair enzyme [Candidatus Burarchaeum australiense]|nr:G/T mismatches repair enzyme [Candidatus Burarchaeum australiense]
MRIFKALYCHFGERHWWPGDSPFEVVVGAVLTQNTNWGNAEKAIANLKKAKMLDAEKIAKADLRILQKLVRPSGFYRQKAKRLREVARWYLEEKWKFLEDELLRLDLLGINGVGEETADSIMLYALGKPEFVVDAYTRRFCNRHKLCCGKRYSDYKRLFEDNIPNETALFNELHAQIVELGKNYCKKEKPLCEKCPLKWDLEPERLRK